MNRSIVSFLKQVKHRIFMAQRNIRTTRTARSTLRSTEFSGIYSRLTNTFDIPPLPQVQGIWGVAMVKNEADIIESSLRHLVHQGVKHILVVDNGSTDGTYALLQQLKEELPLSVGNDREPAYYQSEKMTWLAHQAQKSGATWVIPFDADEFWYGIDGSLAQALEEAKTQVEVAHLYNAFPARTGGYVLDTCRHADSKVCFRSWDNAVLGMGNHTVLRPGDSGQTQVAIVHLPWRSQEQLHRKLAQGAKALELTNLPEDLGYHWRANGQLSSEDIECIWDALVEGRSVPNSLSWRPVGKLLPLGENIPPDFAEVRALLNI